MHTVEFNVPLLTGLRRMFYLISPNETTFETIDEVPDYLVSAAPFFATFITIEMCISFYRGDNRVRINDGITSIGAGILSKSLDFIHVYLELTIFTWIHNNYRIVDFDWSSPVPWWIALVGMDLGYYWFHRMAHEVNLFWAVHQAHHSSEDYNFSTALRQSVLQTLLSWMFYQPLALLISPVFYAVHKQFNILYQFWIHTQYVKSLGPLEYIMSTPSHHRVHHGRNRYCIDKNYAGTFIIWDKLFGTFAPESEQVVYGLTHPVSTFDPTNIQVCHFRHMWTYFWQVDGFTNKLHVLLAGPGWSPGKSRLGDIHDIPDIHAPAPIYNTNIPSWCSGYVILHFLLITLGFTLFMTSKLSVLMSLCFWSFTFASLTSFGFIFQQKLIAPTFEAMRCVVFIIFNIFAMTLSLPTTYATINIQHIACSIYSISLLIWVVVIATRQSANHTKIE